MTKKELRIHYKNLRRLLTDEQVDEWSLAIANEVARLPIWDYTYYHVFLPIVSHREVDTEFILHILAGKDKEVVVSRSDFNTRGMTHYLLTDNTTLRNNEYGIPEPVDGIEVPSAKIDVVFVPLLAFDKKGNRVGYGKGFYDIFLAGCRPDVLKVGLSFYPADEGHSEVFESDVTLDYCVTPGKIYKFSGTEKP